MSTAVVHGQVDAGFGKVADAFTDNFRSRGDTGAACAVYADGKPVVDIWAGDTMRGPWTAHTKSVLFSVSKGVTTVCLLMAADAGLVDLDACVTNYWPEYMVHGKGETTVRQVLAHRAGLPAPEQALTVADLAAWIPVTDALAQQAPLWPPGTAFAYHALTVGWLAGEILRRATGMRPSEWLSEHISDPLGLQTQFGADPADADFTQMLTQLPIEDPIGAAALIPTDMDLVDRALTMNHALGGTALDLFTTANTNDYPHWRYRLATSSEAPATSPACSPPPSARSTVFVCWHLRPFGTPASHSHGAPPTLGSTTATVGAPGSCLTQPAAPWPDPAATATTAPADSSGSPTSSSASASATRPSAPAGTRTSGLKPSATPYAPACKHDTNLLSNNASNQEPALPNQERVNTCPSTPSSSRSWPTFLHCRRRSTTSRVPRAGNRGQQRHDRPAHGTRT